MEKAEMNGLVKISRYAGMREDLVQAGGGNSSYKITKRRMAVKASGFQMADICENDGYVIVNPEVITEAFMKERNIDRMTEADAGRILNEAFIEGTRPDIRPSIETFLHAITGSYTLHTHPVTVNALASRRDGMMVLQDMFPASLAVPYATPGIQLAIAYFKQFKKYGRPVSAAFLQNHGLVVSADTAEEVIRITEEITGKLEQYLGVDMTDYHDVTRLHCFLGQGVIWRVTDCHVLTAVRSSAAVWNHAFCPDCVVFLGKKIYKADGLDADDLHRFKKMYGVPVIISYHGGFYIHAASVRKALEIQSILSFVSQVVMLNRGHECSILPDAEQDFLAGWDKETYRRDME